MIDYQVGNFINEQGLKIITVNCVGVPGKGLALTWAQIDPNAAARYKELCARHELHPGDVWRHAQWLLVATKDHWRDPSQIHWIEAAMPRIITLGQAYPGRIIHIPPMGAGLGGLTKQTVEDVVLAALTAAGEHATPDRNWVLWNF